MRSLFIRNLFIMFLFIQNILASSDPFIEIFPQYSYLAGALVMLGIFLSAIVYMIGTLFLNEKIKEWAKKEIVELFYSGILFAIIIFSYHIALNVATSLTYYLDSFGANIVCSGKGVFDLYTINGESIDFGYANLPCHMKVAKNFFATLFWETASLIEGIAAAYGWYNFLSSWNLDISVGGTTHFFGGGNVGFAPFGYLQPEVQILYFIFDKGILVLSVIRFQEILINMIAVALFPVLLSGGMILRLFSLTRRLGGLLIAIAISLYFVFPMFYVLGSGVLHTILLSRDCAKTQEPCPILADIMIDFSSSPLLFNTSNPLIFSNKELPKSMDIRNITETSTSNFSNFFYPDLCSKVLINLTEREKRNHSTPLYSDIDYVEENLNEIFATQGTSLEDFKSSFEGWFPTEFHSIGFSAFNLIRGLPFEKMLNIINILAKALFFSLFFSFLGIFSAIAAIKTLSPMLGGDPEIAGLTHLI